VSRGEESRGTYEARDSTREGKKISRKKIKKPLDKHFEKWYNENVKREETRSISRLILARAF